MGARHERRARWLGGIGRWRVRRTPRGRGGKNAVAFRRLNACDPQRDERPRLWGPAFDPSAPGARQPPQSRWESACPERRDPVRDAGTALGLGVNPEALAWPSAA